MTRPQSYDRNIDRTSRLAKRETARAEERGILNRREKQRERLREREKEKGGEYMAMPEKMNGLSLQQTHEENQRYTL